MSESLMKTGRKLIARTTDRRRLLLNIISGGVLVTGLITIYSVLVAQSVLHPGIVSTDGEVTVLIGLTFVYLASLLDRGKRNAWMIALPLYIYIVLRNFYHFILDNPDSLETVPVIAVNLVLPALVLLGLVVERGLFRVRSELSSFLGAAGRAALVLLVAFMYGLIGFQLMDTPDFHQEISWTTGAHYTVDQFGLTTEKQITPYTKRANLFLDSLAAVSIGSVVYVAVSLFAPIKFRLTTRPHDQADMRSLLEKYPANSEDFFKLWPMDKAYFFNADRSAAVAYRTVGGRALVVGDPAGNSKSFKALIQDFENYCRLNGWEPALIHTQERNNKLFEGLGYTVQKLGEEAVLDIGHYNQNVAANKHFRNIRNRFAKQGYGTSYSIPPHDPDLIKRLRRISNDWLKLPGRSERGFMMGYFTPAYLQQCDLILAHDKDGTVQGFINRVPSYDQNEANFDFLRHSSQAPGNINDFLMISFIDRLSKEGVKRLNLGLSPLAGLGGKDSGGVVSSALNFVYASGGRFYSFSGLKRFKSKFEPEWQGRYIVYKGGIPGFTRTINALVKAMRV